MLKKTLLYLTLAIIAFILAFTVSSFDPDIWHRLVVGSLFFQTGGVLKHDIFAYTPTKDLWVDHEWGSGVIFYFISKHFGPWGLLYFKALLVFLIFILIVRIIQLRQAGKVDIGILYFIFIAISIFAGVASPVRCQLFTYLFFTLWIYVLERVRQGESRLIWIFPATMLLWANMHGGFIAGLGLIFIYMAGEFLNGKNPVKYIISLALTLTVTLINPYGLKFWRYMIEAIAMPRPGIEEWKSVFSEPSSIILGIPVNVFTGFMIFVFLVIITGLWLAIKRVKPDWTKIFLFAVLIYMGILHKRHTVFLVLAASSLLYSQFCALFASFFNLLRNKLSEEVVKEALTFKEVINYTALVLIAIYLFYMPKGLMVLPRQYPVGSVQFLLQNNISGNVLTNYRWGNYILWKLFPQCRVAVDGRYEEVYPDKVFDSAMNFNKFLNKGWQDFPKKYHTDIIIVNKSIHSPETLSSLKGWKVVYEDSASYLLLPESKAGKSYIIPSDMTELYWHEDLSKKVILE